MSLRLKTIVSVAFIEAFFLFVLIMNSLSILEESHSSQIEQRGNTLARLFANATTDAVLSTDLATLDSMISDLTKNPEIISVKVFDSSGLLAEKGRAEKIDIKDSDGTFTAFKVVHPIEVEGENYGRVEIWLDTKDVALVWQRARQESIQIALMEIFLVALASLFLGYYLTRQIKLLQTGMESARKGNFAEIANVSSADEIGQTIQAFNEMARALQRSTEENVQAIEQSRSLASLLGRRELWLKAVVDNILDGIITFDHDGKIISSNKPVMKMLGYDSEELSGQDVQLIILDDEHQKRIDQFISESRQDGRLHRTQTHGRETGYRRNGEPFTMRMELSHTRFEDEDIFIMLLRDLSEQEAFQQKALISETIKAGMLESSLSAVVAIDEHDHIVEFNPSAEEMFGFRREEVIGREMAGLIMPARFRAAHRIGMKKYLETGVGPVLRQRIELAAIRKSEEEFPIEMAITPIHTEDEVIFTAVIDDISDRIEATRKLEQAKEEADLANQAKTRFLASISHEIRTPLNIILGMIDLIQAKPLAPLQKQYLIAAESAGRNLLEMVNDVLDLSKIEAGKMEPSMGRVNLVKLFEQTVELFRHRAGSKNLAMYMSVARDVPASIVSDGQMIRQIMTNLIGNAIKYTEKGGVYARLKVLHLHGLHQLVFEVEDTGPGIAKEKQSEIFEELTQLHKVPDGATGTGLGLVISRQLANILGGDLSFKSEEGKGSTFSMSVPLENWSSGVAPICLRGSIILLLSSDSLWVKSKENQIHEWGGRSISAVTLHDAMAVLESYGSNIGLILMDGTSLGDEVLDALMLISKTYGMHFPVLVSSQAYDSRLGSIPVCLGQIPSPAKRMVLLNFILRGLSGHEVHDMLVPDTKAKLGLLKIADIKNNKLRANRILLVEDSEANRIIAETYLMDAGYQVDKAVDGLEAVKKASEAEYDIILMDMRMPKMGGIQATQVIRQELGIETPIIALTAHALQTERDQCLNAGMQEFLTKPINKTALLAAIGRQLESAFASKQIKPDETGEMNKKAEPLALSDGCSAFSDEPLIKPETLQQLLEDTNESALKRMLNIFDSEARKRLTMIADSIEQQQYDLLETYVHALKSSAQTFGAYRLHLVAKKAEALCKAQDYEAAKSECLVLPALVEDSLEALQADYAYK